MKRIGIIHAIILFPFMICAGFLLLLGKCLGLTYKQISVIFNLYLQGGVLAISGAMPFSIAIWRCIPAIDVLGILILLVCFAYFSIYIVGYIALIKHYHTPMEYAFNLCVTDLQWISKKWKISYHAVNLIIFIVWWLSLVGVNMLVSYSIFIYESRPLL